MDVSPLLLDEVAVEYPSSLIAEGHFAPGVEIPIMEFSTVTLDEVEIETPTHYVERTSMEISDITLDEAVGETVSFSHTEVSVCIFCSF